MNCMGVSKPCVLRLVHPVLLSRAGPSVMVPGWYSGTRNLPPLAAKLYWQAGGKVIGSTRTHDSTKNTLPRLPTLPTKWKKRSIGERATATPTTASALAAMISMVSISPRELFEEPNA